ncbi:MAG: alanine--tRNA ligase [Deltaproteobacteria bacterium]|nr:alanine--tRNA ligase [Deltaproteobacteria bacterium]
MNTNEIRTLFLNFFASKGHAIVSSSSLVPVGDPTLLFVNAGMVQFKDLFLGTQKRDYVRAATSQKCLRISGKHNDLENVGRTARHHTFFEMLGNFSFGDYFKEEAILFAWEFLTKELNLPKNRLWVTVFRDDDEAAELWRTRTDVLDGRILRFGEEDNFWAMGDTGPCGPCSEIHYYIGNDPENQSAEQMRSGTGEYLEIWNLVFMQFNRAASGELTSLPKPSVDTGMGLERIAAVKQMVASNYDSDLLRHIISFVENLSKKKYVGKDYTERDLSEDLQYATDVAMRVITDHSRACAFLVADEVNPGSDGRGYVLRRLIRRACRHGKALGFNQAFLYEVAAEVVRTYGETYPELKKSASRISKIIRAEEEKFIETLDTGMSLLTKEIEAVKTKSSRVFPGEIAFTLHDTYGFPLDMTEDIVKNYGFSVDTRGFDREMEKQRERSRQSRSQESSLVLQRVVKSIPTQFVGYEYAEYESSIAGLFDESGEIEVVKTGDQVILVAKETPFYAESGGQVGDTGAISSKNASLEVIDVQKVSGDTIAHICLVKEGELCKGEAIRLAIDDARRKAIRANHSATHLLHSALRGVLGEHVKQAGSKVSDLGFRFDFSHFEPVSASQLEDIETVVNAAIREDLDVNTQVLKFDEAVKCGAMALFGEKYGDLVRVVRMGNRSLELCGGTHVGRTGEIGLMTVVSESGISAGVRRLEARAGTSGLAEMLARRRLLGELSELLRVGSAELCSRVEGLLERNAKLERQVEHLDKMLTTARGADLVASAVVLPDGVKVIAKRLESVAPKQLREMADDLKQRLGQGCIALASVNEGKVVILTAVTDNLTNKYHAGKLIQELSKVVGGSGGGGRADMAQAGGGDPHKLELALERFRECVS